jgi:hypothetical protein
MNHQLPILLMRIYSPFLNQLSLPLNSSNLRFLGFNIACFPATYCLVGVSSSRLCWLQGPPPLGGAALSLKMLLACWESRQDWDCWERGCPPCSRRVFACFYGSTSSQTVPSLRVGLPPFLMVLIKPPLFTGPLVMALRSLCMGVNTFTWGCY